MNPSLRILLTNDDGLFSNGLGQVDEVLGEIADVWSVAPDRERSGNSQAITIRGTMRMTRVADQRYMVSGYPVDCVNVGLYSGKFPSFDMVVSGINHGPNLGDDVHYSGTVGAARHAAIHGLKAIAMSSPVLDHKGDMTRMASWLKEWILKHYEDLQIRTVYNINYPVESAKPGDPYPPVRITRKGTRIYNDQYQILEETQEETLIRLAESVMGHEEEVESDFRAFSEGAISITPLSLDPTNDEERTRWLLQVKQKR